MNGPSLEHRIGYNGGNGTSVPIGSSGSKGSWVELGQATQSLSSILLTIAIAGGTAIRLTLDIAISSTSGDTTPEIIVADLWSQPPGSMMMPIPLPIRIPAGSYVYVRGARIGGTGVSMTTHVIGEVAQPWLPTGYRTMELLNPLSSGTPTPDCASTVGTWFEIVAATAAEYDAIGLNASAAGDVSRTAVNDCAIEVGKGSAAAEVTLASAPMASSSSTVVSPLAVARVAVPAGSRIAGRVVNSTLADTLVVCAYGLRG